ncbi:lanthionine synthetase C family protein [Actinomadura sp. NPDC047616]|uniref:lanthionine synthetase C family protein n=1 Tax=Actinomadura sp. NPDC047616 TaxID=3155914 RepID=UPI0033DB2EC6
MTVEQHQAARTIAAEVAERLASPAAARGVDLKQGWWPQSLAYGAVGVALLHIERAHAGESSWQRAHDWLACAAAEPVVTGEGSHLYYGAPALAFALHAAVENRPGRYARALAILDRHIAAATRQRLQRAHTRLDRGELPALAEFDTIRGLTGIGALLLRRETCTDLARDVLTYLVRLTEPLPHDGDLLPGWWSDLAPSGKPSPQFPDGHANSGIAHGIAGPLALLALAARHGIVVDGQLEAIGRICGWLDQWRQPGPGGGPDGESDGAWWPYWITRRHLRSSQPGGGPGRPSWCYGTAGLARAHQLAALATGDKARQQMAEHALLGAMTDPAQLTAIADWSLCHGFAGLAHITRLAAADATTPSLSQRLADCVPRLLAPITGIAPDVVATCLLRPRDGGGDIGFLEGAAGVALALLTHAQDDRPSLSGWETCLLIN